MRTYSLADVHATRKRKDAWWTVLAVDPLACPLTRIIASRTRLTPNQITVFSLILGMAAAGCFAADRLIAGAILFYLSFLVDCVDGKIARLKGTGTPFGLWLDYVGDRLRVVACAAGLSYGQYALTGEVMFVVMGAAVAVLDLFRYVNAPQMKRVREELPEGTRAAKGRWARRLARRRMRSHLFSGIEFHAAVFVAAPLLAVAAGSGVVLVWMTVVAGALLLGYEVHLVYRLWIFTRQAAIQRGV
ncbi:CDP-alcohol phosphatidyltransferase family protein [Nonomuraea sp. NPDC050310]|uniref:CDP-alcohol phosphatidyltransferase family protein n=1 Tax=unclassified Nonomuraea TaxID=2593643 RepID=UPI0033E683DE